MDDNELDYTYTKCGDIEVYVFKDGTEHYRVPSDYQIVYDEYDDSVSCPHCDHEEIYYHDGEFICIECESTFTKQELDDYAGGIHL